MPRFDRASFTCTKWDSFTEQFSVELCILDNFPPGVTVSESRRGSQAAESDFYSKPLKGQHVSLLYVPEECLAEVNMNV